MPADVCVIFNQYAGRGQASRRLAAIQRAWAGRAVFWPTEQPGHAEVLAKKAAESGFRMVVAAGGDGTVHEVANGILEAHRPEVVFSVVPIGSANDYAFSLENDGAKNPNHNERLVDVGMISDPAGRHRYFVCCLGMGFNGMVTQEFRRVL